VSRNLNVLLHVFLLPESTRKGSSVVIRFYRLELWGQESIFFPSGEPPLIVGDTSVFFVFLTLTCREITF
jgi:hypothetical protein